MAVQFSYSAIVGQDEMKLAILLAAVDWRIGGVLVFGDRGTGQSTADLANGPGQRIQPYPETIALLESLGAVNNHPCISC